MKHYLLLLAAFFLLVQPCCAENSKIKVGVLIPLSGKFAEVGEDCKQGINLAMRSEQEDKIELVFGDSQAEPKIAVNEFKKMVERDKVQTVILTRSPVALSVNPLAAQAEVPVVGTIGHRDFTKTSPYSFAMWSLSLDEGKALANYLSEEKLSSVAIISLEDDWTLDVARGFLAASQDHNLNIVLDERILPEETQFNTLVARVRAKNPDAIILNAGIAQDGMLIKRLREQGVTSRIIGNFWMGKEEVWRDSGSANINGAQFIEMKFEYPELIKQLQAMYPGSRGSAVTISCYSSLVLIHEALKKLPPLPSPKEIADAMKAVSEIKFLGITYSMIERRAKVELAIKEIRDGAIKIVKNLEF